MIKNTAGQFIGVQMITAADGTAFTGTVSVLVTKDNGTQTAGAGTAPVHEGNGYHSYAPTQAETNADHVAFTFIGTGAIPTTVQTFPGDALPAVDLSPLTSGIISGAAATGTLSTTQASSNLTGYGNDQLIGRVIIWLTGAAAGEASDITDYVETAGVLTFTALTIAPGNGDTFKIV